MFYKKPQSIESAKISKHHISKIFYTKKDFINRESINY